MKSLVIAVLLLGSGTVHLFFAYNQSRMSRPDKVSGVDVYIYSSPVSDYDVIESGSFQILVDCNEMISKPIKKAAKIGADGVIIYPEKSRFDAIKYQ